MITWPEINGKSVGIVLRSSSWDTTPGIIADQTRSGKFHVRMAHVKTPDTFNVTMHMTLDEYRVFDSWWRNVCRKGFHAFVYPKINDNSGVLAGYQFAPGANPSIQNTSGDNLEISMTWQEAS